MGNQPRARMKGRRPRSSISFVDQHGNEDHRWIGSAFQHPLDVLMRNFPSKELKLTQAANPGTLTQAPKLVDSLQAFSRC